MTGWEPQELIGFYASKAMAVDDQPAALTRVRKRFTTNDATHLAISRVNIRTKDRGEIPYEFVHRLIILDGQPYNASSGVALPVYIYRDGLTFCRAYCDWINAQSIYPTTTISRRVYLTDIDAMYVNKGGEMRFYDNKTRVDYTIETTARALVESWRGTLDIQKAKKTKKIKTHDVFLKMMAKFAEKAKPGIGHIDEFFEARGYTTELIPAYYIYHNGDSFAQFYLHWLRHVWPPPQKKLTFRLHIKHPNVVMYLYTEKYGMVRSVDDLVSPADIAAECEAHAIVAYWRKEIGFIQMIKKGYGKILSWHASGVVKSLIDHQGIKMRGHIDEFMRDHGYTDEFICRRCLERKRGLEKQQNLYPRRVKKMLTRNRN